MPSANSQDLHVDCVQVLPEGCNVTSTEKHGVSFWAQTGRIDVLLRDGTPQSFFIKAISNKVGMDMTRGEFQSISAMYNILPEFVPRPIACGTYRMIPDTHFFLCEFREMTDDMPSPHKFAALLSTLHQKSVSPTGKFGFHITTYAGNLPQFVAWEDSWEAFFAKTIRQALDLEIERKGPSDELDALSHTLFEKSSRGCCGLSRVTAEQLNLHLFIETFGTQMQGLMSRTINRLCLMRAASAQRM